MGLEEKEAVVRVKRTSLLKTLKQLNINLDKKRKKFTIPCELTIIQGFITLTVPGASFSIEAKTDGSAKAAFGLVYFTDIVKSFKDKEIIIRITANQIAVNSISFNSNVTFFEDDSVLRSVMLPMNFTELDLLSLNAGERYTQAELRFNSLHTLIAQAENRLRNRINAACRELTLYEVTKEQIEALVNERILLRVKAANNSTNPLKEIQSKLDGQK